MAAIDKLGTLGGGFKRVSPYLHDEQTGIAN